MTVSFPLCLCACALLLLCPRAVHALDEGVRLQFSDVPFMSYAGLVGSTASCNGDVFVPPDSYATPTLHPNTKWCAAEQRIYDPTTPFSPRQYLANMEMIGATYGVPFDLQGTDRMYSWTTDQTMMFPPPKEKNSSSGGETSSGGGSSEESSVSQESSTSGGEGGCPVSGSPPPPGGSSAASSSSSKPQCNLQFEGYTVFSQLPPQFQEQRPVVQCAAVPVDLMDFQGTRLKAFDTCISQRININYLLWIKYIQDGGGSSWNDYTQRYKCWAGVPNTDKDHPAYNCPNAKVPSKINIYPPYVPDATSDYTDDNASRFPPPWVPPCATRYFDSDYGCIATMTIQQCCSIITKPVVPMNALKVVTDTDVQAVMDDPNNSMTPVIESYMAPSLSTLDSNGKCVNPNSSSSSSASNGGSSGSSTGNGACPPTVVSSNSLCTRQTGNVSNCTQTTTTNNYSDGSTGYCVSSSTNPLDPSAPYSTTCSYCAEGNCGTNGTMVECSGTPSCLEALVSQYAPCNSSGNSSSSSSNANNNTTDPLQNWTRYLCDLQLIEQQNQSIQNKRQNNNPVPDDFQFANYARQFYDQWDSSGTKYIGAYMPYMRHWDTGAMSFMPRKFGSFLNTLPSYDEIVGVGREGATKQQLQTALKLAQWASPLANDPAYFQAQITWLQSLIQNNGRLEEEGRYGGWGELKGDQALTMRYFNLMCLPRYEKLFKLFDGDNFALSKAGTYFTAPEAPPPQQQSLNLSPWLGAPGLSKEPMEANAAEETLHFFIHDAMADTQKEIWPWPLGWRGYGSETAANKAKGFPFLYGEGAYTSLDNAQGGDIILLNFSSPSGPFTRTYYVADKGNYLENTGAPYPDYLYVVAWNDGKFPTSTGITDRIGQGPEFMMYRDTVKVVTPLGGTAGAGAPTGIGSNSTVVARVQQFRYMAATVPTQENPAPAGEPSCVDPAYDFCVVPTQTWQNAIVFRPSLSVSKCPLPQLADTYNGNWILPNGQGGQGIPHAKTQDMNVLQQVLGSMGAGAFSYCINAGYDPPLQWRGQGTAGDFGGAGQITFTRFCPPNVPLKQTGTDKNGNPTYAPIWTPNGPWGSLGAWGTCASALNPWPDLQSTTGQPSGNAKPNITLPSVPLNAR